MVEVVSITDGGEVVVVGGIVVADGVVEVVVTPVPMLTCLFSSLNSAASISLAGTAVADIRAKNNTVGNDQQYILDACEKEISCTEIVDERLTGKN